VTTKSVERAAEAIGQDIAAQEQVSIQRAMQLDLPIVIGKPIPILYVQMDGTGVAVVKSETVGRVGKTEGEPARTREVKLGCVFTQNSWDDKAYPIRNPDSTTYTGAIESAEEFGKRIYREAWNRGWSRAEKKVVMGDGAEWIWNLAEPYFPGAIQIVDLYHARQHVWELARKLYPNDQVKQKAWIKVHQRRLLDKGKIEKLVAALRAIDTDNPEVAEALRIEAAYFEKNAERMRYPKFRRQHLFCRIGGNRSGLQDRDRLPAQRVRNVLDGARRQRNHRPPMLPPQRSVRRLLGGSPPGRLIPLLRRTPTTGFLVRHNLLYVMREGTRLGDFGPWLNLDRMAPDENCLL
jgi:hypothetical protein